MASAEWEDVDIDENYGDDYAPEFSPQVVGAYARPNWFFQGPLDVATEYFGILSSVSAAKRAYLASQRHQRAVEGTLLFQTTRAAWRQGINTLSGLGLRRTADYLRMKAGPLANLAFALDRKTRSWHSRRV